MGRDKREISQSGIYQIYAAGINKQKIFCNDEDFEYFLYLLKRKKEDFELMAYCLLKQSANLLVKEREPGEISVVLQKILTAYAAYFNRKYERSGSLFESRYKSMPIMENEVFDSINFIHKSAKNYTEYPWNSYVNNQICTIDFSDDYETIHKDAPKTGYDLSVMNEVKDRKNKERIENLLDGVKIEEIGSLPKQERNEVLKMLRENGFTIGQLMRYTGISRSIVTRSNKEPVRKKTEDKRDMQVFLL